MSKRTRQVLGAAIVASGLLAVPGGAGAQSDDAGTDFFVEAPRQVTADDNPVRLYVSPQIAVHPDDSSTVALAAGDARNGGCRLYVSRDGALSWSDPTDLMPEDLPFCVQRNYGPVLGMAFASTGRLYVGLSGSTFATEPPHPNGPITALTAVTDDLGQTHETFVVAEPQPFTYTPPEPAEGSEAGTPGTTVPDVTTTTAPGATTTTAPPAAGSPDGTQTGVTQHRLNSVAVDPNDPQKVYRGWREGVGGLVNVPFGSVPVRSMIAVSDDGGQNWSEPIDVAQSFESGEEIFGSDVPMMVVDPDGTAYGFTKERPRRAADGEPDPIARLFMFKSTDGGATWSTSVINPGFQELDNPAAAVDPSNGNLYVVYSSRGQSADEDEAPNPSEAYFLASADGGETWSEPVNVTDDDPARSADQYFPGISVADNGRIDLAWYDFRNDQFFSPGEAGAMGTSVGQRYWDVYYASSRDEGRTWAPNTRVTEPSVDGQLGVTFNNNDIRGPMGIASADEVAYVTWADSRATGADATEAEDAYLSRIRYVPARLGAGTGDSSNLLWAVLGAGAALALGGLALFVGTRLAGNRRSGEVAMGGQQ